MAAFFAIRDRLESVGRSLPQHAAEFFEGTNNWLRILKLCAKLAILDCKARHICFKRNNLLREQQRLLLEKINNVF